MNLFFSPPVKTYTFLVSHHDACHTIQFLISTSYVQFQLEPYDDSNDPFYKIYSRLKTLTHKIIKMIQTLQLKYQQPIKQLTKEQKILTINKMKDYMDQYKIDHLKYLDLKQHQVQLKFQKFKALSKAYDNLLMKIQKNYQEIEICKIKMEILFKNNQFMSQKFTLLTGACENKQRYIIQRLIFRKTQGHSYTIFIPRQHQPHKYIFMCFLNQGIYKHIGNKLEKIFLLNNVVLYDLPNFEKNLQQHQKSLYKENQQLQKVLKISGQHLTQQLRQNFIGSKENLKYELARAIYLQRLIYIICHCKKIGNGSSNYLIFTIHLPSNKQLPKLPISIIPNNQSQSLTKRTILPKIPCLNQVNILSSLYSIPKHNQILPSIFMFATVPILFGMMFSDFGHGLMLLAVTHYLKLSQMFYLMAFMSIYCGIIYNQFFGMKIIKSEQMGILHCQWGNAQNGLNFQNSLKMKISMILAFVHMAFGLVLKIINQIKRSQRKMIIYDSLPKLGLLMTSVGYLVLLIIKKWLKNFIGSQSTAPSIINSMLELYLGWNQHRIHSIFHSIQTQKRIGSLMINLNIIFILVMVYNHTFRHKFQQFISIGGKKKKYFKIKSKRIQGLRQPYLKLQDQQFQDLQGQEISQQLQEEGHRLSNTSLSNQQQIEQSDYYIQQDSHQSQLGPLQVFQYVLSLISSTTSYLRLFALSLAHSKLSHLLLTFLLSGLSSYEPNLSFIKCVVFFIVTVGMMLVLDVMECMMHVVRLHWVQWMGKFYIGGGKLFNPEIQENYEFKNYL